MSEEAPAANLFLIEEIAISETEIEETKQYVAEHFKDFMQFTKSMIDLYAGGFVGDLFKGVIGKLINKIENQTPEQIKASMSEASFKQICLLYTLIKAQEAYAD